MNRLFVACALGFAFTLVGCTVTAPTDPSDNTTVPSAEEPVVSGMPVPGTTTEEMEVIEEEAGAVQMDVEADAAEEATVVEEPVVGAPPVSRTIDVAADNWNFSPSMISAKQGEQVTIRLTGAAGIHGFAVPGLGINQRIEAGQTVTVTLPTDTAGTFSFSCSIPCGQGHREMKGSIVIEQ